MHNGLPRRLEADRRETPLAGCKVAVAEHGQRGRRVRPGAGKGPAEAQHVCVEAVRPPENGQTHGKAEASGQSADSNLPGN